MWRGSEHLGSFQPTVSTDCLIFVRWLHGRICCGSIFFVVGKSWEVGNICNNRYFLTGKRINIFQDIPKLSRGKPKNPIPCDYQRQKPKETQLQSSQAAYDGGFAAYLPSTKCRTPHFSKVPFFLACHPHVPRSEGLIWPWRWGMGASVTRAPKQWLVLRRLQDKIEPWLVRCVIRMTRGWSWSLASSAYALNFAVEQESEISCQELMFLMPWGDYRGP